MRRYDAYCSALSVLTSAKDQDLSNEFVQGGVINKFSLHVAKRYGTALASIA